MDHKIVAGPRIIEYKSDKLVAEGKYMQAVFESLKESGMLSIQRNRKESKYAKSGFKNRKDY